MKNWILATTLLFLITPIAGLHAGTFTCVTYNIHQGQGGPDDVIRPPKLRIPFTRLRIGIPDFKIPLARGKGLLDDIARMLTGLGPDAILLQEVNLPSLSTLGLNQAEHLAGKLGMHLAYGTAHREIRGIWKTQGNAILSRHPIVEKRVVVLTGARGEDEARSLVLAKIRPPAPRPEMWIACTHLASGNQSLRLEQIPVLVKSLAGLDAPVIFGGDFNAGPDSPEMRALLTGMEAAGKPLTDAHSAARDAGDTWIGSTQIDYIMHTAELATSRAWVVRGVPYSDHLPWIAMMEYEPTAAAPATELEPAIAGPRLSLLGVSQ